MLDEARSTEAGWRSVDAAPSLAPEELLTKIAGGDDRVFESLYDQLAGKVWGLVCGILRDPAQSDEVTQEIFVELWRAAPTYVPDKGSVTAWTMAIAHRRAVDRVRTVEARTRRERRVTFESNRDRPFDQVSERVLHRDDCRRLTDCLAQLTTLQRESIRLAYYEGRTCQQIAEANQLSVNTVKSRLRAALTQLHTCLKPTA